MSLPSPGLGLGFGQGLVRVRFKEGVGGDVACNQAWLYVLWVPWCLVVSCAELPWLPPGPSTLFGISLTRHYSLTSSWRRLTRSTVLCSKLIKNQLCSSHGRWKKWIACSQDNWITPAARAHEHGTQNKQNDSLCWLRSQKQSLWLLLAQSQLCNLVSKFSSWIW